MTNQEIINGLKNAISRGIPLEKAMQSFVNAGYNMQEVQEAGQKVSAEMGVTGQMQNNQQAMLQKQSAQQKQPKEKKMIRKKIPWKIIGLLAVLLALIGGLIFVFFI